MLGVPGSGKSTYVANNLSNAISCNPDYESGYLKDAKAKFYSTLVGGEQDVVFDFVNTDLDHMRSLVDHANEAGYTPTVIHMDISPYLASHRTAIREHDPEAPHGDAGRHVSWMDTDATHQSVQSIAPKLRALVGDENFIVITESLINRL